MRIVFKLPRVSCGDLELVSSMKHSGKKCWRSAATASVALLLVAMAAAACSDPDPTPTHTPVPTGASPTTPLPDESSPTPSAGLAAGASSDDDSSDTDAATQDNDVEALIEQLPSGLFPMVARGRGPHLLQSRPASTRTGSASPPVAGVGALAWTATVGVGAYSPYPRQSSRRQTAVSSTRTPASPSGT